MADSRRQDPIDKPAPSHAERSLGTDSPALAAQARGCRECGSPRLTLVSDGDLVAIYRCPACGHLSAPVKER